MGIFVVRFLVPFRRTPNPLEISIVNEADLIFPRDHDLGNPGGRRASDLARRGSRR